jgi:hypothetical protein
MIFVKAKANRSHQSFRFNSSHLFPRAKKKIKEIKSIIHLKTPPSTTTITSIVYMIKTKQKKKL